MYGDPIENTEEYKEAMKKIQPELDRLIESLEGYGLGSCHVFWNKKKSLLKEQGIDWETPAECNPDIRFD